MWGFVDLPGFGGTLPAEITQRGHDWVWPAGEDPFNDTYVSEDGIGYGPIGLLLFLPLLAWFALAPGSPPCRRVIAVAAGSFIVAHIVVVEPYAFAMHTMVTGVLLGAPLLAWAAERAWLRHVVAAVAVVFLIPVLFQNQKKPLCPTRASGLSRAEQQSLQHDFAPALAGSTRCLRRRRAHRLRRPAPPPPGTTPTSAPASTATSTRRGVS